MNRLFFCLFLTSIFVSDVWAETPPPDEVSKPFTVYYSLWNRVDGHPDFEAAGLVEVPFIGGSNIFNLNCFDESVSTEECLDSYNENRLRSGLQKIATEKGIDFSGLIHVDIEAVPIDSDTKFKDNSWLYYAVADVIREELPNAKFAWYGSVGPFGHAGLVHKGAQAHIEQAMAKDDFSEPLFLLADATNPQVYTAEDDQEQWKSITEFRINEMRRLAPGKPIYPVIKVVYNIGGELEWQPIPYEFMKFKLETLLELGADGVVIWEGAVRDWGAKDEDTEFWPALLDFMAENDLSGSSSNTAPTISDITSQTISKGGKTGAVAFTVGDAQTAAGSLTLSGSSSNPTLVPNSNIVFGGSGASRTVTVTPAASGSGAATVTVTVSDGSLTASDSFTLTVTSSNVAPTVSLSVPAGPFTALASIALSATAADTDGTISKVDFYNGVTLLGTDSTSPYSFTWSGVAAGTYTLTAKATDNQGAITASSPVNATVNAASSTVVTLAVTDGWTSEKEQGTAVWEVTRSGGGTGSALTVNFSLGGTATLDKDYYLSDGSVFGSVIIPKGATSEQIKVRALSDSVSDPGETMIVTLTPGTGYSLGAKISGTANITDNPEAVNAAPTVSLSVPAGPFTALASIALSATAADTDGTISKVDFYNGVTLLGTDSTSPYNFTWSGVAAGTYTLTAQATDNQGAITASSPVNVTVNAASSTVVTLAVTDGWTSEKEQGNAVWKVTRSGGGTGSALTVNFSLGGTATLDKDYYLSDGSVFGSVIIPKGATSEQIKVRALSDSVSDPGETIIVTLTPGTGYSLGAKISGTANITDVAP